jgi:hypothetical protein
LKEVMPEMAPDPAGAAYVMLLMAVMDEISEQVSRANGGDLSQIRIALIHERCNYDAALQRGFKHREPLTRATKFSLRLLRRWDGRIARLFNPQTCWLLRPVKKWSEWGQMRVQICVYA